MSERQGKAEPRRSVFDAHAATYSAEVEKAFGPFAGEHDFFVRDKARIVLRALERARPGSAASTRLLDVGCGVGLVHRYLVDRVQAIDGVDLSEESLAQARAANRGVSYFRNDPGRLPFEDRRYDAAILICVLHHVPPGERELLLQEVARVLKPGGLALAIEHNPYNPATRWVVSRSCLDEDAVLLRPAELAQLLSRAGFDAVSRRYVLFTPFKGRLFRALDDWLGWLPAGAQYVVSAERR